MIRLIDLYRVVGRRLTAKLMNARFLTPARDPSSCGVVFPDRDVHLALTAFQHFDMSEIIQIVRLSEVVVTAQSCCICGLGGRCDDAISRHRASIFKAPSRSPQRPLSIEVGLGLSLQGLAILLLPPLLARGPSHGSTP